MPRRKSPFVSSPLDPPPNPSFRRFPRPSFNWTLDIGDTFLGAGCFFSFVCHGLCTCPLLQPAPIWFRFSLNPFPFSTSFPLCMFVRFSFPTVGAWSAASTLFRVFSMPFFCGRRFVVPLYSLLSPSICHPSLVRSRTRKHRSRPLFSFFSIDAKLLFVPPQFFPLNLDDHAHFLPGLQPFFLRFPLMSFTSTHIFFQIFSYSFATFFSFFCLPLSRRFHP